MWKKAMGNTKPIDAYRLNPLESLNSDKCHKLLNISKYGNMA